MLCKVAIKEVIWQNLLEGIDKGQAYHFSWHSLPFSLCLLSYKLRVKPLVPQVRLLHRVTSCQSWWRSLCWSLVVTIELR